MELKRLWCKRLKGGIAQELQGLVQIFLVEFADRQLKTGPVGERAARIFDALVKGLVGLLGLTQVLASFSQKEIAFSQAGFILFAAHELLQDAGRLGRILGLQVALGAAPEDVRAGPIAAQLSRVS